MTIAKAIWNASTATAENFNYFRGPSFDNENYLRELGFFHRYHENWSGHKLHLNSSNFLIDVIRASDKKPYAHIILQGSPIANSYSDIIQPKGSRSNLNHHDTRSHLSKAYVNFTIPLYEEMRAIVLHKPPLEYHIFKLWREIIKWMQRSQATISFRIIEDKYLANDDCLQGVKCAVQPDQCN